MRKHFQTMGWGSQGVSKRRVRSLTHQYVTVTHTFNTLPKNIWEETSSKHEIKELKLVSVEKETVEKLDLS